jgi:methylenetetrahydrofolate reductase (NADPH)
MIANALAIAKDHENFVVDAPRPDSATMTSSSGHRQTFPEAVVSGVAERISALHIRDMYARPRPTISFEFFPPKNAEAEAELFDKTMPALKELGADFFSVTFGAGGGTRDATLRISERIRSRYGIESVCHLTCTGSTRETIAGILDEAKSLGLQNILALRGDPPKGQTTFTPTEGGFSYALDLIRFARPWGFSIGAACYPEGHVECTVNGERSKILDWDRAAAKVEAGADFLITQLFYDWSDFLAMEDYLRNKHGVRVPIIPGVLPFLGTAQIRRFTSLCGSTLSADIQRKLDAYINDDESVRQLGVEVCTEICRKALAHGVKGIHFYCLNRTRSCQEVFQNLGLRP